MWEVELNNKKTNAKVVEPVGSKDKWYGNANDYWSVIFILARKPSRATMESSGAMVILVHSISSFLLASYYQL